MTEKLYLNDSYITKATGRPTAISGDTVSLDRTVFYPTGGGQPCDTGFLEAEGARYQVTEVFKKEDEVFHRVTGDLSSISGEVSLSIDWDRRYSHMRYHTAIHIIDAIVHRNPSTYGLITGSQIYQDRARVDFDFPEFSREIADKIIGEANVVIAENHTVKIRELSQAEALAVPGLARTGPGRELLKKLDTIRVIEIEGVDAQADGGTHVRETAEVGTISLSGIESKGRHNKRLNFVLSTKQ